MDSSLGPLFTALPKARKKTAPFRFFSLPYELRSKILLYCVQDFQTIDLDPANHRTALRRLSIFLTSRRLHDEASHLFYSSNTFRILPTHYSFLSSKSMPLPVRLPTPYREALVSLELRLGTGWSGPPKSWRVDSQLGLEEMLNVRTVSVFIDVDPSHDVFKGFRRSKDFYTGFAATLLEEIIRRLPALAKVVFDGLPSFMRGSLVNRLIEVASENGKQVIEKKSQQTCDGKMAIPLSSANGRMII